MPENSIVAVHGGQKRRGCTDVLFLVAFLAGIGYLFFVLHYSRVNGDMNKIIYGQDYMGDLCGQDNSVEATGVPAIVEVTVDTPAWRQRLPFFDSSDRSEAPDRILRGQRDHSNKPYLFYTLPLGSIDRYQSIAVCVERCPGVSGNVSAVNYSLTLGKLHVDVDWNVTNGNGVLLTREEIRQSRVLEL